MVEIPEQEMVDKFLPKFETPNKMSFENPKNMAFSSQPDDNTEFKYQQNKAMFDAIDVLEKTDKEFGDQFGRSYKGMVEEIMCDDAEVVLVTLGSITGTVRVVAEQLRAKGLKVGILKIRYMRPFPEKAIMELSKKIKAIGVIDKDISFGYEGTIFTNVNSALAKANATIYKKNFIGGCRLYPYMKMNSLLKIRDALKDPKPEQIVTLEDDLSKRAARCIERMFELAA